MRHLFFLTILFLCFLSFSCSDTSEPVKLTEGALQHRLETQLNVDKLKEFNDPFFLDSVYINGTELWMEVGYSGGCGEHDFMVAWPEVITIVYPPDFGITLYHNANEDVCEAFIHDTLKVDLTDTPVGKFDPATIAEMRLTIVNGSRPEESKSTR